jgi:hypothetical protein
MHLERVSRLNTLEYVPCAEIKYSLPAVQPPAPHFSSRSGTSRNARQIPGSLAFSGTGDATQISGVGTLCVCVWPPRRRLGPGPAHLPQPACQTELGTPRPLRLLASFGEGGPGSARAVGITAAAELWAISENQPQPGGWGHSCNQPLRLWERADRA